MMFMKLIHLMIFLVPMMMATMNTMGMKMNTTEMKMKIMVMMMILWSKVHQGISRHDFLLPRHPVIKGWLFFPQPRLSIELVTKV